MNGGLVVPMTRISSCRQALQTAFCILGELCGTGNVKCIAHLTTPLAKNGCVYFLAVVGALKLELFSEQRMSKHILKQANKSPMCCPPAQLVGS